MWQELLDTERNAKCRKARVWYSCGIGELEHLGSTSCSLKARSKRTSHCQILLELLCGGRQVLPQRVHDHPASSVHACSADGRCSFLVHTTDLPCERGACQGMIRFEQARVFDTYTSIGASAITDAVTSTSTMNTALDLPLVAPVATRPLLQAMLLLLFERTLRTCIFESLSCRWRSALRQKIGPITPPGTLRTLQLRGTLRGAGMECTHSQVSPHVANANSVASFG